ncbi:MAG: cell division protein FtsW [Parcubacteria group bacterium]|nr:cell division protein FtsW [Parcubacteria group bacterium]
MTSHSAYYRSLLILTFILLIIGLMALISASSVIGQEDYQDVYYYVKKQLWRGIILGLILMFIVTKINYHRWSKWALFFLIINLFLVGLCFISPFKYIVNNSNRWIKMGPLVFQPSEFLKITYILFLSTMLAKVNVSSKIKRVFGAPFLTYLFTLAIIAMLLGLQPSTGTFLILALSSVFVYFSAGLSWKQFIVIGLSGALLLGILVFLAPYRLERIKTFLYGGNDPLGKGWQSKQSLIGIGSGGFFGLGFGKSVQKYNYLPASHTDAIFSIIAEEFGFLGSFIVLIIYLLFITVGLKIAKESPDNYGKFLATGLTTSIGIQAFINIAAMCKLIPITGIPLPLISYGSSALITNLLAIGIILNIARNN